MVHERSALGGWLGFEPTPDGALVMGDLVLTASEINPVMSKLLESDIEITAVHNLLLRASSTTYYVHVHGNGDPVGIATAIRGTLTVQGQRCPRSHPAPR